MCEGLEPTNPLDFKYLQIQVQDMPSEDLVCHFPKAFEFIDKALAAQGAVFVQ